MSAYLRETFAGAGDDGLIQRFQLGIYPDLPKGWENVDRYPDTKAKEAASRIFERLAGMRPGAEEFPVVRFDEPAQEFFSSWRATLEKRIRDQDEHPILIAHLAKYRSLMPSLALIFHCCEGEERFPIGLDPAEKAAAWCAYLEAHARRIYHGITSRIDTAARLLGEKIKARKLATPFTARDVYRPQWTGLTEPDDVIRALEMLDDLNWVRVERRPSGEDGGRPTATYHTNPRIWEGAV